MSIFKRAYLSVFRRKGKSLILLTVVFILGILIAGTFAIKQATQRVEDNLKTKLGFNASLQVDYEKVYDDFDWSSPEGPVMPIITREAVEKLGSLPGVSFYDYSLKHNIKTKSLEQIKFEYMNDVEDQPSELQLQGVNHLDLLDVKVGRIEMVSGRVFNNSDLDNNEIPVILSEELMNENNIRIDEVLDVKSLLHDYALSNETSLEDYYKDFKFKVVGSFKPITFGQDKNNKENYSIVEMLNRVYTPLPYLETIVDNELEFVESKGIDSDDNWAYKELKNKSFNDSVFITESETDLFSFKDEASQMIEDKLIIRTSQESFQMVAGTFSMLSDFSTVTLKGSAIVTVIIMTLVIVLFLRDRKHEMGIYIALGDYQWKVLCQVTLEVVMITWLGLILSFAPAMGLANKISSNIGMQSIGDTVMIDTSSSYIPAVNLTDMEEDYTIKITPSYVISMLGIGTLVAVSASVIPMFYVTRMKPKKILM